ncbi:disease resistance protein TAO1-like [Argentina anserina]|uniref:disease resistance protein TAO1-like n=1 Tax=Argentina anserina TaxID=57926 RepID=UPI0021762A7D|nr:disease resistance protein TAO1-like [Potentilla anserina]
MRVLDLSGSPLEELPDSIGSLFHFKFLNLNSNNKIRRLPNSICKLLNLELLNLDGCTALEEIPEGIGNLINLRSYLPKGIRHLTFLQFLYFHRCVNLTSLGEEIQFLSNLRQLWISSCENLESLSPDLNLLTALDTLFISDCVKLDLMKNTEGPQGLRSFGIFDSDLAALPPWLEDSSNVMQSIAIERCNNLNELSELQKYTFLEHLAIEDCSNLVGLPHGMHCLTELRELKIADCPKLSRSCRRQLKAKESKFTREVKITVDFDVDTDEEDTSMINQLRSCR